MAWVRVKGTGRRAGSSIKKLSLNSAIVIPTPYQCVSGIRAEFINFPTEVIDFVLRCLLQHVRLSTSDGFLEVSCFMCMAYLVRTGK